MDTEYTSSSNDSKLFFTWYALCFLFYLVGQKEKTIKVPQIEISHVLERNSKRA
jgi:hypothetical protein